MKNALIYAPLAGSEPHFETDLELAATYLDSGYEVTLLNCQGDLLACELNSQHRYAPCLRCKSRFQSGIQWLGESRVNVENFFRLLPADRVTVNTIEELKIESLEHLKSICVEEADIGMAALSSVISLLREPYPDVQKYQSLILRNLVAASTVYFSIKNHLLEKQPDIFLLYNGRYSVLRPALRAAQTLGIETRVHEVTGTIHLYGLTPNDYSHSPSVFCGEIEQIFADSKLSYEEKEKIARAWFEERLNHQDQGFGLYTEEQTKGCLPDQFSTHVANIAIFNSSEDEIEAIKECQNPLYKNQADGLSQIFADFKDKTDLHFFLRIHPNLRGLDNSQTRFLDSLKNAYLNVTIIEANSPVSTYSLIQACDLVITFGSTVGIEAVYLKKPSILLGRSFYETLGACINPKSHAEFVEILNQYLATGFLPKPPTPELAVAKYGFFSKTYGIPFKHAQRHNLYTTSFKASNKPVFIKASWLARVLSKIDYWLSGKRYI